MTLDRSKLTMWLLALTVAGAIGTVAYEHKHPAPPPPPVVVVPDVPPAPPVTVPVTPPSPPPVVQHPPAPPKVARPAPAPKKAKPAAIKQRPAHKPPKWSCARVPAKAYKYPEDMVIGAARARGIPEDGIEVLKRCLASRRVKNA